MRVHHMPNVAVGTVVGKYQPETPAEKLAYRMGVRHTRKRIIRYLAKQLAYYYRNEHAREWIPLIRDWIVAHIKG